MIIDKGLCSLEELDRYWTLSDVEEALEFLEIKAEAEDYYSSK